MDCRDIWECKYPQATARVIPIILPNLERAVENVMDTPWNPLAVELFVSALHSHAGALSLKQLEFSLDEDEENFSFLPIARAILEGKMPKLERLDLAYTRLCDQSIQCLDRAIENGVLHMLTMFRMVDMQLSDQDGTTLFISLANAPRHMGHFVKLCFCTNDFGRQTVVVVVVAVVLVVVVAAAVAVVLVDKD